MNYTPIGQYKKEEKHAFYTIGDLISVCDKHADKEVRFIDTDYHPEKLCSWRGSYDIPCLSYSSIPVTGGEVSKALKDGLKTTHDGYKGGKYSYDESEEFYVSQVGSSQEYKVFGWEVKGNELILITDIDEY